MMNDVLARPPARGRGRPKRVDDTTQRARIVAAARDVFLQAGYDATTMDAVAQRAGVSKKTVYQLFESKDAVFAGIVEAHRDLMLDVPADDDDRPLDETLLAIFRADLPIEAERDRTAMLRLMMMEMRQRPELARVVFRHGPEESRKILAGWLARQVARGRIAVDDPACAADLLMHMAFAPTGFDDDGPRFPAHGERKAHLARAISIFLHGVVPQRSRD
ncbi:MAG: TetR/AcrR family transcriptional regulator [Rhodoplanes sp.]|uniref:TetR/AcrR family transcriptional regulator n=1 Tax=Rhodoplanes sp. TaxID=1968906 RepID=UPI001830832F|nr:TetR/AcrR family transcriptional regulator [Rhodoplanes sp.]NVO13629.1 TetR/AcrR family transcriptional regulator [Rhodoplanes sp.]